MRQALLTCCWPRGVAATPQSAAPATCRTTCLTSKPRWCWLGLLSRGLAGLLPCSLLPAAHLRLTQALTPSACQPCLQVAANTRGIALVKDLIREYSLPVVQAYMGHIQVGGCGRGAWAPAYRRPGTERSARARCQPGTRTAATTDVHCCVQANAERAVREMLTAFSLDQGLPEVGWCMPTGRSCSCSGSRCLLLLTPAARTAHCWRTDGPLAECSAAH